ncbi:FtsX-like permease family protein [Streptomyces sp. NBC_00158]|uniref:FtsX-like permease family protein n=1 Tax=Streptomyces sp. NBC_00158 TaxID=2903627 RepID=UPI00324D0DCC
MLALPIIGMSAIDLTYRSADLSTGERMTRELGAADARITPAGLDAPVYQHPNGEQYAPVGGYDKYRAGREEDRQPLKSALPPGIRSVEDRRGFAKVHTAHGLLGTDLRELDVRDPLTKGLFTLDRGRMPEAPDEVVATTAFLKASGLYVGSSANPRGATSSYRIVGAYEMPGKLARPELLALPGTLLDPLDKALKAAGAPGLNPRPAYLVAAGGDGFTWNMVKEVNKHGALVLSRTVALHPPADSDVPLFKQQPKNEFNRPDATMAAEKAILVTVIGLAMLEICLLAGPAFAVGARRSRRQLGLVGANGGDRRHIRAVVLSGGIVLGAAAAVIGTAVGVALTIGLRPVLEEKLGARFGGFEVRPLELLGIALLAVVTGLLAAVAPAVTASRQSVLSSLTGRRGVRRANRVLPVIGLLAVAGGAALVLYGSRFRTNTTFVMGGSALAELGVVALTPLLVGMFGRLGRWLPVSPRLALRDAVRNRGRTAPAVAAVLAAVAGTVAVSTYQHSRDVQFRHEYEAVLPDNAGYLTTHDNAGHKEMPALRDTLSKSLPVAVRADVDRLVVGNPNCSPLSTAPGCGRAEVIVPKEQRCPLFEAEHGPGSFPPEQARALRQDPRCKQEGGRFTPFDVVVADEKLLQVLAVSDPGSVAALKEGRPVSFNANQVKDGKVTLRLVTDPRAAEEASERRADPPGQDKVLAVHQAPGTVQGWGLELVLPPAAARAAGIATAPAGAYFSLDRKAGTEERQRLDGEIDRMGADAEVRIEEGYQEQHTLGLLALSVFAGLVTIGAAGIATGLAQADSEADLKTLAAVGAAPRVRRTLSGFQCGVVALMGVVLGSAAGVLPAVGLRLTEEREQRRLIQSALDMGYASARDTELYVPIAVPWDTLAGLLVLVPLGAALLAALVTRSSGALARRAAG